MRLPRNGISSSQLEAWFDRLPQREKIALVRKLEAKTLPIRWKTFLRQVDQRRKKYPVTQREIEETVEKVRQDLYERSRR